MEQKAFNFNNPVKVTEIFRYPDTESAAEQLTNPDAKIKMIELAHESFFGWERILGIKEYPHVDNWIKFKGPKYWLELSDNPELVLVYGDYKGMKKYWQEFRNKYPLFT